MKNLEIVQMTMELMQINEKWNEDEILGIIEYIQSVRENSDSDYDVDAWYEETKMNYPEMLK